MCVEDLRLLIGIFPSYIENLYATGMSACKECSPGSYSQDGKLQVVNFMQDSVTIKGQKTNCADLEH